MAADGATSAGNSDPAITSSPEVNDFTSLPFLQRVIRTGRLLFLLLNNAST
jgi:hypothetical protein